MPYRLPINSTHPTATPPPGGMEPSAGASVPRNSDMSVAGEQDRDSQSGGRPVQKKNKQHHEPTSPHLQGRGPLAPQPRSPPLLPVHTSLHPSEPWLMRADSREALRHDGRIQTYEPWMAAAEATGSLTRMLRTKPASFPVPGFFLNLMCCTPFSPYLLGGCLEWGGGFFSFLFFMMGRDKRQVVLRCNKWVSVPRLSRGWGVLPSLTLSFP